MWLWGCDLHALTCNMWKWDTLVLIDYDENSDAAPSALTNATFSYLAIVLHVRMSTQNALIFQIRSAHVDVLTRDSWFLVADDEKNDAALMTLAILTFSLHARVSKATSKTQMAHLTTYAYIMYLIFANAPNFWFRFRDSRMERECQYGKCHKGRVILLVIGDQESWIAC
jgi:hypothetical protein